MKKYIISISIIALLLLVCFVLNQNKGERVFALQPIGNVDNEIIKEIKKGVNQIYNTEITVLPKMEIPQSTFVNIKSPRYRADKLIKLLKQNKHDSIDYVLGIISKDISTTKKDAFGNTKSPKSKYEDWGIFGLGYRPGSSCIVSTFRLKHLKRSVLIDRLKKVCAHELGHNLGLRHCESGENCLMKDAVESIKTVDNEVFALCESCKYKIK